MTETEGEDPLATILREYAGLEGLGRTGRVIRELVAEVRSARKERDAARAYSNRLYSLLSGYEDPPHRDAGQP